MTSALTKYSMCPRGEMAPTPYIVHYIQSQWKPYGRSALDKLPNPSYIRALYRALNTDYTFVWNLTPDPLSHNASLHVHTHDVCVCVHLFLLHLYPQSLRVSRSPPSSRSLLAQGCQIPRIFILL